MIKIEMTQEQIDFLSSYLADCEERILERFEHVDRDGEKFYEILSIIMDAAS